MLFREETRVFTFPTVLKLPECPDEIGVGDLDHFINITRASLSVIEDENKKYFTTINGVHAAADLYTRIEILYKKSVAALDNTKKWLPLFASLRDQVVTIVCAAHDWDLYQLYPLYRCVEMAFYGQMAQIDSIREGVEKSELEVKKLAAAAPGRVAELAEQHKAFTSSENRANLDADSKEKGIAQHYIQETFEIAASALVEQQEKVMQEIDKARAALKKKVIAAESKTAELTKMQEIFAKTVPFTRTLLEKHAFSFLMDSKVACRGFHWRFYKEDEPIHHIVGTLSIGTKEMQRGVDKEKGDIKKLVLLREEREEAGSTGEYLLEKRKAGGWKLEQMEIPREKAGDLPSFDTSQFDPKDVSKKVVQEFLDRLSKEERKFLSLFCVDSQSTTAGAALPEDLEKTPLFSSIRFESETGRYQWLRLVLSDTLQSDIQGYMEGTGYFGWVAPALSSVAALVTAPWGWISSWFGSQRKGGAEPSPDPHLYVMDALRYQLWRNGDHRFNLFAPVTQLKQRAALFGLMVTNSIKEAQGSVLVAAPPPYISLGGEESLLGILQKMGYTVERGEWKYDEQVVSVLNWNPVLIPFKTPLIGPVHNSPPKNFSPEAL